MNIPEFYFAPCFINDDLLIAVYSRQTEGEWCDLSRHGQISFFIGASIVVTSKYILTRRGMSINYNVFTTGGKNHPEAVRYHWNDGAGYTQTAAQRREGCQCSPIYPAEDSSVQVRASDYQGITQYIFFPYQILSPGRFPWNCPDTDSKSWNAISPLTVKHRKNLKNFLPYMKGENLPRTWISGWVFQTKNEKE